MQGLSCLITLYAELLTEAGASALPHPRPFPVGAGASDQALGPPWRHAPQVGVSPTYGTQEWGWVMPGPVPWCPSLRPEYTSPTSASLIKTTPWLLLLRARGGERVSGTAVAPSQGHRQLAQDEPLHGGTAADAVTHYYSFRGGNHGGASSAV
jgi:hypothetical protein